MKNKSGGFTLTELMVVIAILGILSTIAVPKFGDLVLRAREGHVRGNLAALRSAMSIYYSDNNGVYPDEIEFSLPGKYIARFPKVTIPPVPRRNNPGHINVGLTWSGPISWLCDASSADIWFFVNQGPERGTVLVNCWHRDSKGAIWTSY